jgi:hypothetical protein
VTGCARANVAHGALVKDPTKASPVRFRAHRRASPIRLAVRRSVARRPRQGVERRADRQVRPLTANRARGLRQIRHVANRGARNLHDVGVARHQSSH